MNTYKEFTVKQQIIFYAVTLLVASVCFYFDINHGRNISSTEAETEAVKIESSQKFLSGNEVAHSTFVNFAIK